jgi:hypothetical protein
MRYVIANPGAKTAEKKQSTNEKITAENKFPVE